MIGPDIVITVVDSDRGKIRVGIDAPRDVPIWREEVAPADRSRPAPPPDGYDPIAMGG